MVLEGRTIKGQLLLNGYWRKMVNTEKGKARFSIKDLGQDTAKVVLQGVYGDGEEEPENKITLTRTKPLQPKRPVSIIAHRGGGRNNDLLPASENSIEMIKLGARLGATGIEIDVKLSKDGVPVLYHDEKINDRLTEKAGIRGDIGDYSYAELSQINLKRGGKIPTLEQALDTVLYKTPLEFVWLDCKYDGNLQLVRALQQTYEAKAKSIGRDLTILIGMPDEATQKNFVLLPQYKSIPSLTELDTAIAINMNTSAWAPSWTKGLQTESVKRMQEHDMKVYVWTVDKHDKIEEFIREGSFNGIVSNRPGMVAYYYYTR
jgi:glycerophosphoryl diester phosphodiesterase